MTQRHCDSSVLGEVTQKQSITLAIYLWVAIYLYNNCRTVLEILINNFCGRDIHHKLMSVENYIKVFITISRTALDSYHTCG